MIKKKNIWDVRRVNMGAFVSLSKCVYVCHERLLNVEPTSMKTPVSCTHLDSLGLKSASDGYHASQIINSSRFPASADRWALLACLSRKFLKLSITI